MDDLEKDLRLAELRATDELRTADSLLLRRTIAELERLRAAVARTKDGFDSGYQLGQNERIALACSNDELRFDNKVLKSKIKSLTSDHSLHTKTDKLINMVESMHKEMLSEGRKRYGAH